MKTLSIGDTLSIGAVLETNHGPITIESVVKHSDHHMLEGKDRHNRSVTLRLEHNPKPKVHEMHVWLEDELGFKFDRCSYDTLCGLKDHSVTSVVVTHAYSGKDLERITCLSCILLLFSNDAEQHNERENPSDSLGTGA